MWWMYVSPVCCQSPLRASASSSHAPLWKISERRDISRPAWTWQINPCEDHVRAVLCLFSFFFFFKVLGFVLEQQEAPPPSDFATHFTSPPSINSPLVPFPPSPRYTSHSNTMVVVGSAKDSSSPFGKKLAANGTNFLRSLYWLLTNRTCCCPRRPVD